MPPVLFVQRVCVAVALGVAGGGLVRLVAADWPLWQTALLIAAWGMAGIYSVRILVPGEQR